MAVLVFGSGCALTEDHIEIAYASTTPRAVVKGAEGVNVEVRVVDGRGASADDRRPNGESKVSAKKNGYGMEMAAILATNDVPAVLKSAIASELSGRGFRIGAGSIVVSVELGRFWNDFKIGFLTGDASAELTMNVQVKRRDGSVAFIKLVTAQGENPGIGLASGDNAKVALDAALGSAVRKLVSDAGFISALLQANGVPVPLDPPSLPGS
jgi:uncharacterized lipoprotein